MKIVDRKTFLAMPPETLFCKYEPCVFGEITIKGDSIFFESGDDFFCQHLGDAIDCNDCGEMLETLERARLFGDSFRMDFECQGRDGCFDEKELFMVFEKADVAALIERLQRCA